MAYQPEIEKLEQRFREKPEQWFAALADAYRKVGELDMALEILKAWIEKRPNYTSGHIVHGRVLLDHGQPVEAEAVFRRVIELDPENIIAIRSLGDIAEQRGDIPDARAWLARLLEVDPMNDEAHTALERLDQAPGEAPAGAVEAAPQAAPEATAAAPSESPFRLLDESEEVGPEEEPVPEYLPTVKVAAVESVGAVSAAETEAEAEAEAPAVEPEPVEPESAPSPWAPPPAAVTEPLEPEPEPVAEPTDEADETVEMEPIALEGMETVEEAAEAEEVEPASAVEFTSFDDELAWDAGERTSHQITEEDVHAAEEAHEESLDYAAHVLPGLESEEVPPVGVEAREEVAPPEEEEPATAPVAAEEPERPDLGLPPAPVAAGDLETPEEAPLVTESRHEEIEIEREEEPALHLIMPEEVTPVGMPEPELATGLEPEPVVTETMAEVYAQQGHVGQALDIYRRLSAASPGDARISTRVQQLEATLHAARPARVARRYSIAVTGGPSAQAVLQQLAGAKPSEPFALPRMSPPVSEPIAEGPAAVDAPVTSAAPAPGPAEESAAAAAKRPSFSFDEFFGPVPSGGAAGPRDEKDDDDFKSWLQGLKT